MENDTQFITSDCYGNGYHPVCLLMVATSCLVVIANVATFFTAVLVIHRMKPGIDRSLHGGSYNKGLFYLIANLSFADMLTGLFSIIIYAWDFYVQSVLKQNEDVTTCHVHMGMMMMAFSGSMLSIVSIAVDRFMFVCYNYKYSIIMITKRFKTMIALIWIISSSYMLTVFMPWTYGEFSGRPYRGCLIVDTMSNEFQVLFSVTFHILPCTVATCLYAIVIHERYQLRRRMAAAKTGNLELRGTRLVIKKTPPSSNTLQGSTTTTKSLRFWKALTNNSSDKQNKEKIRMKLGKRPSEGVSSIMKTVKELHGHYALEMVVIVASILWLPFSVGLITYVASGAKTDPKLAAQINTTFVMLGILNSLANPLIYALGSKEFRKNLFLVFFCLRPVPQCTIMNRRNVGSQNSIYWVGQANRV